MPAMLSAPGSAAESSPEDLSRFETLLADVTARFLNVSPEAVDAAIEDSLEVVAHAFRADRCAAGQFTDGGRSLLWTHGYAGPGVPWPDLQADIARVLPWYTQQLRERRTLVLPRILEDLPPEARAERERAAATSLKSLLATPLEAGGEVLGTLSAQAYEPNRMVPPSSSTPRNSRSL